MARGRFLSKNISLDRDINQLDIKSALIWTWLIAHLDVEGRFFADPAVIKGQVLPRKKEIEVEDIQNALDKLVKQGKIFIYEDRGDKYLYMPKFASHQVGLRKDREAPSDIPAPPAEELQTFMADHNINGNGKAKDRSNAGELPDKIPVKLIKDKVNLIKGEDEEKLKALPAKISVSDDRTWQNIITELASRQRFESDKEIAYSIKLLNVIDDIFICINESKTIMDSIILDLAEEIKNMLDKITGQPITVVIMHKRKVTMW